MHVWREVDATFFNYSQQDLIRLDKNNHQIWREMSSEILRNTTNTIAVSLTFVVAARIKLLEEEPTFTGSFFCKVGKIECPVLLVNGLDDQNWAVDEYAEDVSRHTHTQPAQWTRVSNVNVSCLSWPLAPRSSSRWKAPARSICWPWFSIQRLDIWSSRRTRLTLGSPGSVRTVSVKLPLGFFPFTRFWARICFAAIVVWGGATKPHSDAQEDSWRKILEFLQHHLYSNQAPRAKMWPSLTERLMMKSAHWLISRHARITGIAYTPVVRCSDGIYG